MLFCTFVTFIIGNSVWEYIPCSFADYLIESGLVTWTIYIKGFFDVLFFYILSGESKMAEAATYLIFFTSKSELTFLPFSMGINWHYFGCGLSSITIEATICLVFYGFLSISLLLLPNPEFWKGLSKAWIYLLGEFSISYFCSWTDYFLISSVLNG